jgi:hypothetical protein
MNELEIKKFLSEKDKTRVFMIENFLSIHDMKNNIYIPFKLFNQQKEYLKALSENRNNISMHSRGVGMTYVLAAYVACEMILSDENPKEIFLIKTINEAHRFFLKIVNVFLAQLTPSFFNKEINDSLLINSKEKIKLINGSIISTNISTYDHTNDNLWVIGDQFAFINKPITKFFDIDNYKKRFTFISTPNGTDNLFYKIYQDALNKKNDFNIINLIWQKDPRYNRYLKFINKDTLDIIDVCDSDGNVLITDYMIQKFLDEGYKSTSEWFEKICRNLNNNSQIISQEFALNFTDRTVSAISNT